MSLSPGRRNQHKSSRAGELFFVSVFFLQAPWYSLTFKIVVVQSFLTLCNPMGCSTPGFPVFHYLLELAQTHVSDAI